MDPAQIIETIMTILSSEKDADQKQVEEINAQLTEAINPINLRLRRCDKLLHEGQRTQAIELCELEPPLLDLVAILDFSDRTVWDDYVEQFSLTPAPPLLVEVAAELNEAYTAQMSLQAVLDQFRLHSLARSPLSVRTSLLRQLTAKDPNNVLWQQDLQAYERARLTEIKAEVEAAVAAKRVEVVADAEQELAETAWLSGRPGKLLEYVSRANNELRQLVTREQLHKLAEQLMRAFSAFDITAGRRLRDRWGALSNLIAMDTTDPLYELAAPALHWIDENDRRDAEEHESRQSLADLESALDRGATRIELERLHRHATRNQDLPASLRSRFDGRMHHLETVAKRRHLFLIMGVAIGGLSLAVGVFGYLRHTQEVALKSGLIKTLSQHLENGDLAAARSDLENCQRDTPWVYQAPEYQKLVADLSTAEKNEQSRQSRLSELIATIRQTDLSSPTWESLDTGSQHLEEARKIADGQPAELAELQKLERELIRERKTLQDAVDEAYRRDLDELVARNEGLSNVMKAPISQALEDAKTLRQREHVSREHLVALDQLITTLEGRERTATEIIEDEKLFADITMAVGNTQDFQSRLQSYLTQFPPPSRPHSESIRRTLEEGRAMWPVVNQWNSFCDTWKSIDPYNVAPEKAMQFTKFAKVLQEHRSFPFPDGFDAIVAHLDAVGSQVDASKKGIFESAIDFWSMSPIYSKVYAVQANGKTYLCSQPPTFEGSNAVIDYYLDSQPLKTKRENLKQSSVVIPTASADRNWDAPQWRVARDISPLLHGITPGDWEEKIQQCVLRVLKEEDLDPILKVRMANDILRRGSDGSVPIRLVFGDSIQTLKGTIDQFGTKWVDPFDQKGNQDRRLAEETLVSLSLDKRFDELARARKQLQDVVWNVRYVWVGWLVKDPEMEWECRIRTPLDSKERGKLVTIRSNAERWTFHEVGSISGGQARLSAEGGGFAEGCPVYLVTPLIR